MNPKELEENYQNKKSNFHAYIDKIKRNARWDIYTIINATLVKNPYASVFPKNFFTNNIQKDNNLFLFTRKLVKYYIKNIYLYFSYVTAFFIYKIYYKKQRKNRLEIIIDTFGLIDKTNENGQFSENYLTGIYEIFEKYHTQYAVLLRPYGVGQNPLKLKHFFKIINQDKKDFVFEYEFLKLSDFVKLFGLLVVYPFKTLRLLQKEENDIDKIFNNAVVNDIKYFSFDSLTRYILGKNLAQIESIKTIYFWSEFQVIERSFNYGIRNHNDKITLNALQFYLNYETYFNAYVDDLDYDMLASPHKVSVNGKYYVLDREKVKYDVGVSLRYKGVFEFQGIKEEKNVLLLGSYIENDTKYMIERIEHLDNVIFKNHPAVNIHKLGNIPNTIEISNSNIYKLFENTKLVIGTASGTSLEAVTCGLSVIIIASQDNLTANPLVTHGKGKIWDIAFTKDDIEKLYNKLLVYRKNYKDEIKQISLWYKENFFREPTEERIKNIFGIEENNL
ncbi:hypothetical protein [Sulfurimonas sp. NWX367]|uniref:hypothetical protein n=1 Tax=Sulfurimonas sp. NWX367 TaxID=2925413 RepID=UPI0032048167